MINALKLCESLTPNAVHGISQPSKNMNKDWFHLRIKSWVIKINVRNLYPSQLGETLYCITECIKEIKANMAQVLPHNVGSKPISSFQYELLLPHWTLNRQQSRNLDGGGDAGRDDEDSYEGGRIILDQKCWDRRSPRYRPLNFSVM